MSGEQVLVIALVFYVAGVAVGILMEASFHHRMPWHR